MLGNIHGPHHEGILVTQAWVSGDMEMFYLCAGSLLSFKTQLENKNAWSFTHHTKGFYFPKVKCIKVGWYPEQEWTNLNEKKGKRKITDFLMVQLCFLFVNIWENHSFIFWMGKGNWNRWSITRSIKQEIYALHIHLEAIRLIFFLSFMASLKFFGNKAIKK